MSQPARNSIRPFPFDPGFRVPAPDAPAPGDGGDTAGSVQLSPAELAEIGALMQSQGAASAQARLDAAALDRLEALAGRLEEAAGQLSGLADLLDRTAAHAQAAGPARGLAGGLATERAAGLARRAAQQICDGQGDLLAALDMLGPGDAR